MPRSCCVSSPFRSATSRSRPIVYFDGIVVHVRGANGRVSQHTIYVALGVNLEGHKELLGLWLSENEGAKFWLSCLTDLKNRGLDDIFVACIDGLSGFAEALHAAYPETKVQLCIVHLVRAALRDLRDARIEALASAVDTEFAPADQNGADEGSRFLERLCEAAGARDASQSA